MTSRSAVWPESAPPLQMPTGEDVSWANWVQEQKWARGRVESVDLPNGESATVPRLPVHIGEWRSKYEGDTREAKGKNAKRMHVEKVLWLEKVFGTAQYKNRARGRMQNYRSAVRTRDEVVDPPSQIDGPEGLKSILESGQFRVTGTVYFRPLQPFNPDPEIPGAGEKSEVASGLGSGDTQISKGKKEKTRIRNLCLSSNSTLTTQKMWEDDILNSYVSPISSL